MSGLLVYDATRWRVPLLGCSIPWSTRLPALATVKQETE